MTIRINGLVSLTSEINGRFFSVIKNNHSSYDLTLSHTLLDELHQQLLGHTQAVRDICTRRGATPADLPTPSLRAYQWLHLLSQRKWLLEHTRACGQFFKILNDPAAVPRPSRPVHLKIYPSSFLYKSTKAHTHYRIEIHEGFILAPKEIKAALIHSALQGRSARSNQLIKTYAKHADFRFVCVALNDIGVNNTRSTRGNLYDLANIYEHLNHEYFSGLLERPRLTWSSQTSKCRLGYFDPESGSITISRRLDTNGVDLLLVEFILYHEMLHQLLGVRMVNGRRHAHTREFKHREQQFKGYERAQRMMKILSHKPH